MSETKQPTTEESLRAALKKARQVIGCPLGTFEAVRIVDEIEAALALPPSESSPDISAIRDKDYYEGAMQMYRYLSAHWRGCEACGNPALLPSIAWIENRRPPLGDFKAALSSSPSPAVLDTADALADEVAKEMAGSEYRDDCYCWMCKLQRVVAAYQSTRGAQPTPRQRLQDAADEATSPVRPQGVGELMKIARGTEEKT